MIERPGIRSPYDPRKPYNTYSVKGKILPWLFGMDAGISGFLGLEYGFLKHHSIGIDGYMMLSQSSHDDILDTAGVKHSSGGYFNRTEKAVMIDYRYYFTWSRLRDNKGLIPYILVFARYGTVYAYRDPLYVLLQNEYLKQWAIHKSIGLMFGCSGPFAENSHWGLDANIGMFVKEKITTTLNRSNDLVLSTRYERSTFLGPRISVNVVYWLFRQ